jgi:hypothetical protein
LALQVRVLFAFADTGRPIALIFLNSF